MPPTSSIELPRILALGARRVLNRDGPEGVTYRAVAAEAGVTVRSIQNRFGSMAGLLDGRRRLAEVHGRIGLTLASLGLGFEPRPLPAPPSDRSATATRRQWPEGP